VPVPTPEQAAALRAQIVAANAPVSATDAAKAKAALTALTTAKATIDSTITSYNALPAGAKQAAIVAAFPALLAGVSAVLDACAATIRASVR
jgi:hypothetical protein